MKSVDNTKSVPKGAEADQYGQQLFKAEKGLGPGAATSPPGRFTGEAVRHRAAKPSRLECALIVIYDGQI